MEKLLDLVQNNNDLKFNLKKTKDYSLDQKIVKNILGIVAFYDNNKAMKEALIGEINEEAVKKSTEIMALTNHYYKYLYWVKDLELTNMSPKLRMQVFSDPPEGAVNFEIYGLAVSILSGCPSCIKAHQNKLKSELSKEEFLELAKTVAIGKMLSQNIKNYS